MKLFYKLLMLTVVAAIATPFILKDEAGQPLMSLDKLHMPDIDTPSLSGVESTLKEVARKLPGMDLNEAQAKVTAYKWQDAQGIWHFSDKADARALGEEITIDTDPSVMRFDQIPVAVSQTENKSAPPSRPAKHADSSLLGSATGLMDKARGINQLARDRFERQSQVIEAQSR